MKNKRGLILIGLGVLLLLGALGLSGYNLWDQNRAGQVVESVMTELEAIVPQDPETSAPPEFIPDYILAPQVEMPTVEVEDNNYIGYLSIPALELKLPVMSDWSYPNLKLAPCRYAGSAYQDDLVICAHNYVKHFGPLARLRPGDQVEFVDIDGNVFHYEVVELDELQPEDIDGMTASGFALSLFTCNFSGQFRTTVRCDRVAE